MKLRILMSAAVIFAVSSPALAAKFQLGEDPHGARWAEEGATSCVNQDKVTTDRPVAKNDADGGSNGSSRAQ